MQLRCIWGLGCQEIPKSICALSFSWQWGSRLRPFAGHPSLACAHTFISPCPYSKGPWPGSSLSFSPHHRGVFTFTVALRSFSSFSFPPPSSFLLPQHTTHNRHSTARDGTPTTTHTHTPHNAQHTTHNTQHTTHVREHTQQIWQTVNATKRRLCRVLCGMRRAFGKPPPALEDCKHH